MASAPNERDEVLDLNELRIMLLGVCGAGKSSTGNAILGREAFTEEGTRESERQRGRVEDRNISIIDTPGFFNTQLTDEEMKNEMIKSLLLSDPGPHVFLLIINLENFEEDERNVVEEIQENFGEEALLFTIVLFIGREKVSRRILSQIVENEETQKMLNNFKGGFHVINRKSECDSSQITKLLKIIDEMMNNNGGQNYSNEIYVKNQMQLREEKERMKELERDLSRPGLRIVLLGLFRHGKCATGNTIMGKKIFKQSLLSPTCKTKEEDVCGTTISITVTPGFRDDQSINDEELKAEIENHVSVSAPGPHVFLLVISLFGGGKRTEKWIQENLEEDALNRTIILFTDAAWLRSMISRPTLDEFISENSDLQCLIDSCGGRFHAFNNRDRENRGQVIELLKKIDEMMLRNGGEHYTKHNIFKRAQNMI